MGILLGLVFLLLFLYRRFKYLAKRRSQKPASVPGALASFRNLLLILLWTAVFGSVFFAGFFFQAYDTFAKEEPVAKVDITPLPQEQKNLIRLELYGAQSTTGIQQFEISGDQWVLEGDILKWENWVNFLGLHTRYRLTRIQGRYLLTADEKTKPASIYSLVEIEDHPFWGFLYRHGPSLPFVSTVYGNAVFQNLDEPSTYLIYVTISGFLARRLED